MDWGGGHQPLIIFVYLVIIIPLPSLTTSLAEEKPVTGKAKMDIASALAAALNARKSAVVSSYKGVAGEDEERFSESESDGSSWGSLASENELEEVEEQVCMWHCYSTI